MALPRDLRRRINEPIRELEELDLSFETPESFQEKIRKATDLLDSHGIISESEYRKRLLIAELRARRFFEEIKQESETIKKQYIISPDKRRIYRGVIDAFTFRVVIDSDEYWLQKASRKNKSEVKLRWVFNPAGRLKNLDYKINENRMRLVQVLQTKNIERQSSEIKAYPIPIEVLKLKPIFRNAELFAVYQTLVRWGYFNSRDILDRLNNQKIEYIPCNPEEMPLDEILNDEEAMKMMRATSIILPYVDVDGNGKYVLKYEPNKDKDSRR